MVVVAPVMVLITLLQQTEVAEVVQLEILVIKALAIKVIMVDRAPELVLVVVGDSLVLVDQVLTLLIIMAG